MQKDNISKELFPQTSTPFSPPRSPIKPSLSIRQNMLPTNTDTTSILDIIQPSQQSGTFNLSQTSDLDIQNSQNSINNSLLSPNISNTASNIINSTQDSILLSPTESARDSNEVHVTNASDCQNQNPTTTSTSNTTTTNTLNQSSSSSHPDYLLSSKTGLSNQKRDSKRQQWITRFGLEHVVLSSDQKNICSIGGLDFRHITVDMLSRFARTNKVSLPDRQRIKSKVIFNIVQRIKAGKTIQNIKDIATAEAKKKVKPSCIFSDGTLFRVINTVTNEQGRASFLATKNDFDKEDIDSKK